MNEPRQIGRYLLAGELGRGGMGIVYRAHDPQLERDVAVKVILFPTRVTSAERAELEERFGREAKAAAGLRHPGVITVFDYGRDGDYLFLVMELVEGESLAQRLDHGRMSYAESLRIVAQIADALQAAHDNGVIHRDVTPRNVLLAADGRVLVTDFGLARSLTDSEAALTQVGMVIGSPHYVAPERAMNRGWDARSDLFSLGVILFQATQGRLPFDAPEVSSILYQIVHEDPLQGKAASHDGMTREIDRLLSKSLEKTPDDRVATAAEFSREARRIEALARSEENQETALATHLHRPPASDQRRNYWVSAVLLALVFAGGLWWASRPAATTEPSTNKNLEPESVTSPKEPPPETKPRSAPVGSSIDQEDTTDTKATQTQTEPLLTSNSVRGAADPPVSPPDPNDSPEERRDVSSPLPAETGDGTPPVLAIDRVPAELSSDSVDITGRVLDDAGGVTLSANGTPVSVAEDGSFSTQQTLAAGRNVVLMVAIDEAGNQTVRTVEVDGPKQALEEAEAASQVNSTPRQQPQPSRYRDQGDGTVRDTLAGITWTKKPTEAISLKAAKSYCRKLELARQNDWMLPTIEELEELDQAAQQLAEEGQPSVALATLQVWSSSKKGLGQPWVFDFARKTRRHPATDTAGTKTIRALCIRRQRPPHERGPDPNGPRQTTPPPRRQPN